MRYAVATFLILFALVIAGTVTPDRYWYDLRFWLVGVTLPAALASGFLFWRSSTVSEEKRSNLSGWGIYFVIVALLSFMLGMLVVIAGGVKAFPD